MFDVPSYQNDDISISPIAPEIEHYQIASQSKSSEPNQLFGDIERAILKVTTLNIAENVENDQISTKPQQSLPLFSPTYTLNVTSNKPKKIISNIVYKNVNNNRELNDVNPKQRYRILKRRSDRNKSNLSKKLKHIINPARRNHARRRPRGSDGRFLKRRSSNSTLSSCIPSIGNNDSSKLTPGLCIKTEPSSYTSNASNMNENFLQSQSNAIELPQISNESNIIQLSIPVILYPALLDALSLLDTLSLLNLSQSQIESDMIQLSIPFILYSALLNALLTLSLSH
ncbi:uncharacterized protein OCT59_014194 [Rhizophagus irregularis]|nr:hypothetical protein GLOIN_2v1773248 [Rhizophagus irregularis DAOM 181602=DAOM 197198]EXX68222.1 hypothetical protein RirG_106990 [Rhizophagus irregularis DAOM 197198w]UZO21809.1 hypothetical protein OCT59_014194 [Rhizophagus irregularis]POG72785.1 hypothetical protein GLOIN_2v1773248 [Rhizophagus irregularis DAOM 181602=DAOM 197198]CAG8492089.1 5236_t:CDS:2 [Rhizophagus irregularis]GBC13930.1 nuclear transcription factor Y subunit A-1-like [Rhizophagus irregularis DAOM 181602=DAOM 197198]|eukprot:XP_025179651.1 hypothetical protein GLOIN_2v1773248 [Rhizophagus irregularis DAOM 181602=DAOM 197198]